MARMKFEIVDADMTMVRQSAQELRVIRSRLQPEMRRATSVSAKNIRDAARRNFRAQTSNKRSRRYPPTITHEVTVATGTAVSAEIGPEKGGAGSLGHIFEFGTSRGMAPIPHLVPAWLAEFDRYTTLLADAAERAVLPP